MLHLYDLSAGDDPKAAEKAEREWKSLQRLPTARLGTANRRLVPGRAGGIPARIKFFTIADPAAPSSEERALDDSMGHDCSVSIRTGRGPSVNRSP